MPNFFCSTLLVLKGFSGETAKVACRCRVDFRVASVGVFFVFCCESCGGIHLTSVLLGDGAVISDVLEGQSSLEDVGIVDFFLSPLRSTMPLCCFGAGFPPDLFPVWGFVFAFWSALFLSWICSRDNCLSRPICSSSFNVRRWVRLAVRYLKNVCIDLFVLRICMQHSHLIVIVCMVYISVGLAQQRIHFFSKIGVVSLYIVPGQYVVCRLEFFHQCFVLLLKCSWIFNLRC